MIDIFFLVAFVVCAIIVYPQWLSLVFAGCAGTVIGCAFSTWSVKRIIRESKNEMKEVMRK